MFLSCLFDVGELLGEEGRGEDLVNGDAACAGDLADVVGEVALVAAGVRQLRLGDLQTDLRTKDIRDLIHLVGDGHFNEEAKIYEWKMNGNHFWSMDQITVHWVIVIVLATDLHS